MPAKEGQVLTMSAQAGIIEHVFDKNMCLMGGRVGHERHTYICIDLKTFYASVECVDRGLDPLTTNLVVADESRGRTTICLAITQTMKDLGIHNRCRLFEIPDGIDYIKAVPRMQHYMEVSAQIYGVYLEYVSPQDVHVYSIDECFIDVTPYLDLYHTDAEGFACTLRDEVLARTGITATVGIGPNLFQAKVALDITAKHVPSRIGILDDETFRKEIWPHRPIEKYGVYDLMGVAALDENLLYDELGVNAEYLIDHAFGREPTTIADIQAYRPQATSTTTGQVLSKGYAYEQAYTVLREMVDNAVLDLVDKHVVCDNAPTYAASTPAVQRSMWTDAGTCARAHRVSNPPQPPAPSSRPVRPSPSSAMTNGVAWCAKRRQSMASLWESMAANRAVAMPHSLRTLTPRESCPSVPIRLRRSWGISMTFGHKQSTPNDRSSASTWDLATSCPRNLPPSICSAISRPMSASATWRAPSWP